MNPTNSNDDNPEVAAQQAGTPELSRAHNVPRYEQPECICHNRPHTTNALCAVHGLAAREAEQKTDQACEEAQEAVAFHAGRYTLAALAQMGANSVPIEVTAGSDAFDRAVERSHSRLSDPPESDTDDGADHPTQSQKLRDQTDPEALRRVHRDMLRENKP